MLEGYADVFSDIVNVLLFQGEHVIEESQLAEADSVSQYKSGGDLYSQQRDVSRFWQVQNVILSLIGLENQSGIDPNMPIRIMNYDSAAYRKQIGEKRYPDAGELRYPVVTIVLYFGTEKKWEDPLCLHDCLKIDERLRPWVGNYPIHVINVAWLPEETIASFQSDFRIIADYFRQVRLTGKYHPDPDLVPRRIREVLDSLKAFSGDNRFVAVYNESGKMQGKETMTMEKWLTDVINEGEARGKAIGEARGTLLGRRAVIRSMHANGLTPEEIARYTDIPLEEVEEALLQ